MNKLNVYENTIFIFYIVVFLGCIGWCMNAYKLTQCDFDKPYKCEAVRSVGVFIPFIGAITGYYDFDK
jgi:hypothetical protein